jgi:7-carboxy-7-deazaguanine synthase
MTVQTQDPQDQDTIPTAPKREMPVWREDGQMIQVNEIFYSIEGEGLRVGQPTTFVRLSKCNLRCHFCDTEFNSYSEKTLDEIVDEVGLHPAEWVCFSGGEPLGQNIEPLARQLKDKGYMLHIETNGVTKPNPALFDLIDHWTVSPKGYPIISGFQRITELKYVVGKAFREDRVQEELADYVYLQPESSEPRHIQKSMDILTRHPKWRLSCRVHKILDLP